LESLFEEGADIATETKEQYPCKESISEGNAMREYSLEYQEKIRNYDSHYR